MTRHFESFSDSRSDLQTPRILFRSRNIEQYTWILVSDDKQCSRGARRCSTALLPVLQRTNRYTEQLGESRLRKSRFFANACNIGNGYNTAILAALDFSESFEDFKTDVSFGFSHLQSPFESAEEHGPGYFQLHFWDTSSASKSFLE